MSNYPTKKTLDAAFEYLSFGYSIFPVGEEKHPLVKWGPYQKRQPTKQEVRLWWNRWPEAQIAIVTGPFSGVVVFDLDKKHNRTSEEFDLPVTASVRSGGGGEHFYFKHPGKKVITATKVFGEGVDMKGDGGFVIAPPSVNEHGGSYEWTVSLEHGIEEMPEWLSDVVIDEK